MKVVEFGMYRDLASCIVPTPFPCPVLSPLYSFLLEWSTVSISVISDLRLLLVSLLIPVTPRRIESTRHLPVRDPPPLGRRIDQHVPSLTRGNITIQTSPNPPTVPR